MNDPTRPTQPPVWMDDFVIKHKITFEEACATLNRAAELYDWSGQLCMACARVENEKKHG